MHFKTRTQISKVRANITGELFIIDQAGFAPQKTKMLLTHIFINTGGRLLSTVKLVVADAPSCKNRWVDRSHAEIDAGFTHINEHAPTGFQRNQNLAWLEKELRNAESPIFGWDRGLVKEAMKNKTCARGLAEKITAFP
eukprot:3612443-Amphidinium_carterae.1